MANTFNNAFITQWNDEVHQLYHQKGSKLRSAIRVVSGVKGSTYKFHRLGTVAATTITKGTRLAPLTPAHDTVTVTLTDHYAPLEIYNLDEVKTNASFRKDYVELAADALGKKTDQLIVGALDSSTPSTITAGSAGMSFDKANEAARILNEHDVPMGDRFMIVSPKAIEGLLAEAKATSSDYVGQTQALLNGEITKFMGFTWVMSNDLSVNTNIRDCYAIDKRAVGMAVGQDIKTKAQELIDYDAWYIRSSMSLGAAAIEDNGIVKVQIDES